MIKSKIGISPVSLNVIDAVIQYSQDHQVQLMFIVSRNQIECLELGKGYVADFTSENFVNYVKGKNNHHVLICRDHSGPFMADAEADLVPEDALEKSLFSIKKDIDAGFDLIHVDCSKHKGDVYAATKYLLQETVTYAERCMHPISFEVGTEENVGVGTTLDKFKYDLEFITNLIKPEFVVGQTGSLVKETYQVGYFDCQTVQKLLAIAHSFGVKFKEHNVDYSTAQDLWLRKEVGVDAINVGPEFGVVQTKTVIGLAMRHCFFDELNAFLNVSLQSGKWRKWVYGNPQDFIKAVTAGHYLFNSKEYHHLITKLNLVVDVDSIINKNLMALIDHYVGGIA